MLPHSLISALRVSLKNDYSQAGAFDREHSHISGRKNGMDDGFGCVVVRDLSVSVIEQSTRAPALDLTPSQCRLSRLGGGN